MKALLISDNENITSPLDSFLKQNGYDTIIYTWLLKALDNVEEIKPDLIILSAEEYPRHWKTLIQFSKSSIGSQNVKIILIISDKLIVREWATVTVAPSFISITDNGSPTI